jgi:uncharacterized protein (DUF305 family)
MKITTFTALVATAALALAGAGCSGTATDGNAVNHNSMNHGSMNHNSMNQNSTSQNSMSRDTSNANMPMDHGAMNHGDMKSSPDAASAPYDLQFLDTMAAHHEGAVEMAKMVEGRTQNPEMKKFAAQIIADQNKEIAQMKDWRGKWYAGKPAAINMEMPGMADSMKMDMGRLAAAKDRSFDLMFVEMMIPHHAGAITMSKEALAKAEHSEIKTLAAQIIKAQEAEIKMMEGWGK